MLPPACLQLVTLFSPSQVWVGLMGGASYVNTFYLLLNHKDIPAKDK